MPSNIQINASDIIELNGPVVANSTVTVGDTLTVIGSINGVDQTLTGNITVANILTDGYRWANGVLVDFGNGGGGGGDYSNANVANFLPVYDGNLRVANLSVTTDYVILGNNAGAGTGHGGNIVAIGHQAGIGNANSVSTNYYVAIGDRAGWLGTGANSVAIGHMAGAENLGENSIAIGLQAGNSHGVIPGSNTISIGYMAGFQTQADDSIAIGTLAGDADMANNSIVINATGNLLSSLFTGTYIAPIRQDDFNTAQALYYNTVSKEITFTVPQGGGGATTYSNANVQSFLASGTLIDNIIPAGNGVFSLGNATNQWSNLWLKGNTLYLETIPIGINASGNLTVDGAPVVTTTGDGNITANYFSGNGSQLTGMYSNANVELYLPDYAGDLPSLGNVTATGNITAQQFNGNGSQLTGMYGDANVSAYLPSYGGNLNNVINIAALANISTTNFTATGLVNLGSVDDLTITGGNVGEVLTTNGSGDLAWQTVDLNVVPPVYLTAPIAGNNQVFSNTILASYTSNTEMTVFYNGSLLENTKYTLSGDQMTVNIPLEVGDGIDVVTTVASSVNSIVSIGYGNSNVASFLPTYTGSFNSLSGDVTTTGNITANVFYGNGSQLTDVITVVPPINFVASASGNNQSFTNTYLSAYSAATDFALFYNGALLTADYYTLTGDVITINTPIFAGDNIDIPQQNVGSLSATITTGYGNSNVASFLNTGLIGNVIPSSDLTWTIGNVTNRWKSVAVETVNASGNITSSGLITGANLNITSDAVILGNATILGNLTYNDVNNITTSNLVIGLGNTQTGVLVNGGGMVVGNTAEASFLYNFADQSWDSNIGISALGNVSGANIVATGEILAGGDIATGGNLAVVGNVTASNIDVSGSARVNTLASSVDIIQGNIDSTTATKTRITSEAGISYIQTGNGTSGSTGNIVFSPWTSGAQQVVINTTTGNITAAGTIRDSLGPVRSMLSGKYTVGYGIYEATAGNVVDVGSPFTLPAAGTYLITYMCRVGHYGNGQYGTVQLTDIGNNVLQYSEVLSGFLSGVTFTEWQSVVTGTYLITVTGPTSYKMRLRGNVGTVKAISDGGGACAITWVQVSA